MNIDPFQILSHLLTADPNHVRLPLEMLLVFGTAKILAELCERFGQPGIVGEILAGVLIGPQILDWVKPNELLSALAELGVMFLLFRVGLEIRASELVRVGKVAIMVAIMGVVLPFALGWGILRCWGEPQIESVFVGAAMVATSVGITAQVLASKGLLDATASKIILAAAVFDDILGLLILAFVSGLARGSVNIVELMGTAVMAIGFTLLLIKYGTKTVGRFVKWAEEKLHLVEAQFVLALVLMFGLALLAIHAGVAAIVGAFLAGMALGESTGHRTHDMAHGVTELLVPFFLAGIGLHFDLSLFTRQSTVILAMVVMVAAVLSKLVGCGLGAIGLGRADAVRVGVGMVPRGEVGMVVAQIGLSLGTISQAVYGIVVFMAVTTTLVAPPMLKMAFRGVELSNQTTRERE